MIHGYFTFFWTFSVLSSQFNVVFLPKENFFSWSHEKNFTKESAKRKYIETGNFEEKKEGANLIE
jgi:hypothetical protein